MNPDRFQGIFQALRDEIERVIVGQADLVEQVLVALLARGHVLVEGVPGLGKTLLARALAAVFGLQFKRIQFTPDLMPSDITGGNVFDAQRSQFVFQPGPVFTQFLLADEINRAPAKTQSALLEAMQEGTVTADGVSRPLPDPFFVIATQNPVESQGTYPLPEAQLDRFLMKLLIVHPTSESERAIVKNYLEGFDAQTLESAGLRVMATQAELGALRRHLGSVRVDDSVVRYITEVVGRTRAHPSIYLGASPRASLGLTAVARAKAASQGRDYVTPDDVKSCGAAVLRHRLLLHPDAELENVRPDDCIESILREVPVPRTA
ncbi:MAG: MoxR family ATPase [Polyangiaceae bacterium]|nr:MoxR family ATPase [Polyangiaceae bacterium]